MISAVRADAFAEPASQLRFTVRKAAMRDIPAILDLINGYAARGVMLPRTEFELSSTVPRLPRFDRSRFPGKRKPTVWGANWWKRWWGKRSSMNWALSLRLPTLLNFSARWVFNKSSGGCCR